MNNCFPSKLFFTQVKKFLNKNFIPKCNLPTVPKLPFYASVPMLHKKSFYDELKRTINNHIPAINMKIIPKNPLTIGSLFRYKEKLSPLMTSSVIYKFNCPRCDLGTYVGSTQRLLRVRIDCHRGVSYRTGCKLTNPEFSSIRNHAKKCKYTINYDDFKILGKATNGHLLTIKESLLIKALVPQLNSQTSSAPLYLT